MSAWKPLGLLAALAVLFFHPLILHPGTILYSDHSDFLTETLPAKRFLVRSWQQTGELPLWCPYSYGGMPFIHDVKVAPFYPPHWILYPLPEAWLGPVLSWMVVLHVLLAGVCMYALARDQGLTGTAALVAAIGYMFAGKWLIHLLSGGQYVLTPLAWMPLVLLALERAIRRRSVLWTTVAGVVFALVVLGGHPQATVYAGLFIAVWTLGPALEVGPTWRTALLLWLACGLGTVVVGAALSAVALLPAIEGMTQAMRGEGVGSGSSLDLTLMVLFDLFGVPWVAPTWETSGGLGVLWGAVAVLGVWGGSPRVRFQAGVALLLLAFGLGGGAVLQSLPGLSLFQIYPRMLLFLAIPVALLAGVATQALLAGTVRVGRARQILGGVVLLALLLAGARVFLTDPRDWRWSAYWPTLLLTVPAAWWLLGRGTQRTTSFLWTLVLLVDVGAVGVPLIAVATPDAVYDPSQSVEWVIQRRADHGRVLDRGANPPTVSPLDPALPLLFEIESLRGYNSVDVRRYKQYLSFLSGDERPVRPRKGAFGFPVMANFPIENKPLLDLLGVRYLLQPAESAEPRPFRASGEPGQDASWRERLLDAAPAAYVLGQGVRKLPAFRLYENTTAFPRAFVVPEAVALPDDPEVLTALKSNDYRRRVLLEGPIETTSPDGEFRPIEIREYRPNRVVIDLQGGPGGYLVMTDVWYPGWQCQIDGRAVPVQRGNYVFRTVAVPAGAREAVFTFVPASYTWGLRVSLAAAGLLLVVGLLCRMRLSDWQSAKSLSHKV